MSSIMNFIYAVYIGTVRSIQANGDPILFFKMKATLIIYRKIDCDKLEIGHSIINKISRLE